MKQRTYGPGSSGRADIVLITLECISAGILMPLKSKPCNRNESIHGTKSGFTFASQPVIDIKLTISMTLLACLRQRHDSLFGTIS